MAKATVRHGGCFLALLGSFFIYAIPLPGPHAVPLLGSLIVAGFSRPDSNPLALPIAAFALTAQLLTFLVLRWRLGETRDTSTGRGSRAVPKGRGITSLDIDPEGRWIAYSTSAPYNLGGVDDSVIVISALDGNEVFRDSLPTYTRSDVVFVGPGRLAYTSWDGASRTDARVVQAPLRGHP